MEKVKEIEESKREFLREFYKLVGGVANLAIHTSPKVPGKAHNRWFVIECVIADRLLGRHSQGYGSFSLTEAGKRFVELLGAKAEKLG